MPHPNMGTPIINRQGEYEATSFGIETELESVEVAPFKEFDFDLRTQRLRCAGYTPAEVYDLLHLYREHLRLLGEQALRMQAGVPG